MADEKTAPAPEKKKPAPPDRLDFGGRLDELERRVAELEKKK